jgi:20S proteasome alpha/beta subunit
MTNDVPIVIERFGSTSLVQGGSNYFLEPNGGSAVELSYGGAPVVAGQFDQFGAWAPIGAEQTASGYEVAWKVTGADQFQVWNTDSSGNFVSSTGVVSGTSAVLESFETSFQQDLNGDGVIGRSSPQFVYQGVDGNGVQLYSVTWGTSGSQPFAVRVLVPDHPSTDYEHNFLFALPVEAGLAQSTYGSGLDELRQLDVQDKYDATIIEPIFPIDSWYANSNIDATINFETFTATLLTAWVDSNFATSGIEKNLLIGFSKSGYGDLDLLFKHPTTFDAAAAFDFPADMTAYDEFGSSSSTNYGTDANFQNNYRMTDTFIDTWRAPFTTEDRVLISEGDVFAPQVADFDALLTSQGVEHTLLTQTSDAHSWPGGWLSDAVAGLYGLETDLRQTVIEGFGSTSLIEVGNNYFLEPNGGSAVELSYGGAPVVAGQFDQFGGPWAPIGAEQTASGYEVAWKVTGADQYTVWSTDNNGNYLSNAFNVASGTSAALENFETSFHQDLNGDGVIGPPPPSTTVIEGFGSTSLVESGSNYFLEPNGGSGVELSYGGAPVVAGQFDQFGAWAPIGAEQTASGYEVAWKVTGADQYTVWSTDNNGNYLSSAFNVASGTSAALENFETSFHQDLNGDGYIGLVLNGSSGGQTLTAGTSPTTLIGGPNDVLIGGPGADTFVFPPNFGANTVSNFTPGMDALQFGQSTFADAAAVLNAAQQVASNVVITHDSHSTDVVTLQNVQLSNLHTSDFHIV